MPARQSIRHKRTRGRLARGFDLQLTAMLDVLIVVLVFLLKSMSTTQATLSPVAGVEMPKSISKDVPADSPRLVITPEAMIYGGERILDFQVPSDPLVEANFEDRYQLKDGDLDEGGRRILPLYNVLVETRDQSELLRAKSRARDAEGRPLPFEGVLAIQADKRVDYRLLRKVMYTAATADFKVFRFLAVKDSQNQ